MLFILISNKSIDSEAAAAVVVSRPVRRMTVYNCIL